MSCERAATLTALFRAPHFPTATTLSSKRTVHAYSHTEMRRELTSYGEKLTSCTRSCDCKAPDETRNAPSSQSRAHSRWDLFCDDDYLAISMGPLQSVPKIVGIPVPCCDPSDVEL
jgi:hypothetical protein